MNRRKAKQKYIKSHSLGHLTIRELRDMAKRMDIFIYGDKAQILQCFDLSKSIQNAFKINKKET